MKLKRSGSNIYGHAFCVTLAGAEVIIVSPDKRAAAKVFRELNPVGPPLDMDLTSRVTVAKK